MKRSLALLALAGLALTGCTVESPAPAATSEAKKFTNTQAPTEVRQQSVSVSDYIAATAPIRGDLQEWVKKSEELACGFGESELEPEELHESACKLHAADTASQAYLVVMVLEGLNDEAGSFSLGPPPTAIARSVKELIYEAELVKADALMVADDDCGSIGNCFIGLRQMKSGMHSIVRGLDSWAELGSAEPIEEPTADAEGVVYEYLTEDPSGDGYQITFGGDSNLPAARGMDGPGSQAFEESLGLGSSVSITLTGDSPAQKLSCDILVDGVSASSKSGQGEVTCRASSGS